MEHLLSVILLRRLDLAAALPAIYDERTATYKMPHTGLYQWAFGGGSILCSLMIPLGLLATSTPYGTVLLCAITVAVLWMALLVVGEGLLAEVCYSDRGLMVRNRVTGTVRGIRWDQVSRITFLSLTYMFCFKADGARGIRVSRYRIGFNAFRSFAWNRLPQERAGEFSALATVHIERGQ